MTWPLRNWEWTGIQAKGKARDFLQVAAKSQTFSSQKQELQAVLTCGHYQHSTLTLFFWGFLGVISLTVYWVETLFKAAKTLSTDQEYCVTCSTTELWVLLVKNLVVPALEDCRWADTPISLLPRDTFIWGSSSSTRDLRRLEQRNLKTKLTFAQCSCVLKPWSCGMKRTSTVATGQQVTISP